LDPPSSSLFFIMSRPDRLVTLVLVALTVAFGLTALPLLLGGADRWDMVGHTFHAWLQREMLPQPVFWNPYFYSGYEQFAAYPPLLSLLVAIVSLPLGLTAAFKLIVITSWMALPGAIYFMYRGLIAPRLAAVGTGIACILLVLIPQQIGGTYFSTFVVGNVANTLGLVLFLLCLGLLIRENYKAAIPLLAILILTHMIASLALSLFVGLKFLFDRRAALLSLGYGLAACWLVPALFDSFRRVQAHDDYFLGSAEYLLCFLFFAAYLLYRVKTRDANWDFLVLGVFVIFVLNGVLWHVARGLWLAIPMHYHRLKLYPLLILVPISLGMAFRLRKRPADWLLASWTAVAVVVIAAGALTKPLVESPAYEPPDLRISGTRVVTVEQLPEAPHFHNLRHQLAEAGHLVAKGLFIEASPDASFYLGLEQILHRDHQVAIRWGIDWDAQALQDEGFVDHLPLLLELFGIQAVVADVPLSPGWADPGSSPKVMDGYTITERLQQQLVDVPAHSIRPTGTFLADREWRELSRQWFLSRSSEIVVEGPELELAGPSTAKLADHTRHYNTLHIEVESTQPVPVYIRMGYSSKWHAYSGDEKLPVYRATPNNMLVVADRDFDLRYESLNAYNWLGLLITAIAAIGYVVVRQ
jgi:hypothetical protein